MITKQKATGRAMSVPRGLTVGVGSGLITMISGIGILAMLIDQEVLQWPQIGYGIMIVLLVSSAAGSAVSCHMVKHRFLMVGGLYGCAFFMLLLGITGLLFGGQYEAVGVTALLTIGGSVAAAFLTVGGGRTGKGGRKRKFRH